VGLNDFDIAVRTEELKLAATGADRSGEGIAAHVSGRGNGQLRILVAQEMFLVDLL
jgi:hypothetical protein